MLELFFQNFQRTKPECFLVTSGWFKLVSFLLRFECKIFYVCFWKKSDFKNWNKIFKIKGANIKFRVKQEFESRQRHLGLARSHRSSVSPVCRRAKAVYALKALWWVLVYVYSRCRFLHISKDSMDVARAGLIDGRRRIVQE